MIKNYAKYQEILMASSEKGQIVHGGQWEIDPKCAKTHKYLNLGHTLETSKMTTRQANHLKSIKKMKNYAKYQENKVGAI